MIGGVSARSWQYWERGERRIPDDVIETMRRLCAWRQQAIAMTDAQMRTLQDRYGGGHGMTLVWYPTLDDWLTLPGREPLFWRPHCSVVAELAARHGAQVIAFDRADYTAWLSGRADSEAMRSQWAAERAA